MTEGEKKFIEVILRFKKVTNVNTNKAVASLLHLSEKGFAKRKKRGSIPEKEIRYYCLANNIPINSIMVDTCGAEIVGATIPKNQSQKPTTESPSIRTLLHKTELILTKGPAKIANALTWNIEAFAHAVDLEHNLKRFMAQSGVEYQSLFQQEVSEIAEKESVKDPILADAPSARQSGKKGM